MLTLLSSLTVHKNALDLHFFVKNHDVDSVKSLLKCCKDVNAVDGKMRAALHLAASNGNVEIVELLVAANANVDLQDRYDETPLMVAIGESHVEIVEFLLEKARASASLRNNNGKTALHLAITSGNCEIVKTLTNRCDVDLEARVHDGITPLLFACKTRFFQAIVILINNGANPKARSDNGFNAFDFASRWTPSKANTYVFLLLQKQLHPSLQELCRLAILHYFRQTNRKCKLDENIEQLPLPNALKNYLKPSYLSDS